MLNTSARGDKSAPPLFSARSPLCSYYSPSKVRLQQELQWCFSYFPKSQRRACVKQSSNHEARHNIPFLLLPHGALCDSGPLVAEALSSLDDETNFFYRVSDVRDKNVASCRTVVLVGTEHGCTADNFICLGGFSSWKTPLGSVEVDAELFSRLSSILPIERRPFVKEHSIENQLPFLQYMAHQSQITLRIVTLSVKGHVTREDFLGILQQQSCTVMSEVAQVLADYNTTDKKLIVIATTDYSHVGPEYGLVPPGWPTRSSFSIPDYIRYLDQPMLDAIQTGNITCVFDSTCNSTMCGSGAAMTWMCLMQLLRIMSDDGDKKSGAVSSIPNDIRLLRYVVGSDIGPQHDNQTGFATFLRL